MRYFLDTQLYSYRANKTIPAEAWLAALGRRELWLSAVTAWELLQGLLNATPHTLAVSSGAVREAAAIPEQRTLALERWTGSDVRRWLRSATARPSVSPAGLAEVCDSIAEGRSRFLQQIHAFRQAVGADWKRAGDLLFSASWRRIAGIRDGDRLDAAFVFQTAVLDRSLRIRYNADRHPSDFLDYLQLGYLREEDLVFVTADRKLVQMTTRSLDSDRIVLWSELLS